MTANQTIRWVLKPVAFVAALGPAGWLVWAFRTGQLSVNPLSDLTNETGVWALRFLCITLAITPLRRLTGWNGAIRFRRMVGLFAFFYGSLHFLTYVLADRLASVLAETVILDGPPTFGAIWQQVNLADTGRRLIASVVGDISSRPFITVGFTAFILMVPLALTSTAGMIRRLGGRRWNALHRLVYASAVAGVVHYWWLVKADVRRPIIYGIIVLLLLAFRVVWARAHRPATVARARTAAHPQSASPPRPSAPRQAKSRPSSSSTSNQTAQ